MTPGVQITLIICITILLIFGMALKSDDDGTK